MDADTMLPELIPETNYLLRMADGTIKQVNPFTGTEVWTVPGRGNRPLGVAGKEGRRLDPAEVDGHCPFCARNYLETPPEKARLVGTGNGYETLYNLNAERLFDTVADFRRVANLFEIVSCDYWQKNFGYTLPDAVQARMHAYLSTEAGRHHVLEVLHGRMRLSGMDPATIQDIPVEEKLRMATGFFGGGHELIIARRHFVEGATHDNQLASSGALTPAEHYQYMRFTIDAVRDIYLTNRYVRYVAVFQNWLKPAGASFDHLHKQLVAIDERGVQNDTEVRLARANPNIYNDAAVNFAGYRNLVFAENDHAIAFAGFGHRYPTLEIFSKSERSQPWNHSAEELRGMSDIIHACHAAMGAEIPCNEEWYYKPPDADVAMPWRVLIKWRTTTPAGFEGGTKIYVNTIDPESLRDKVVPRLFELKNQGRIAPMKIAFECDCVPNCLKYNPAVRRREAVAAEFAPLSGEERYDRRRSPNPFGG
jgi:galactose-1-phosphate uridylyltransferase